ncbi:MAG TPA: hypothetical protein VKE98_14500, partial [Gemmataceae bacterium]|nr:hypothetical protein [Gemmataceae bacterium]
QLSTSWAGSTIAAGEFQRVVHIWDLASRKHLGKFETVLGIGKGSYLSIASNGKWCICAAFEDEGVAMYSTAEGNEIWRRKDLGELRSVRIAVDEGRVYCCCDSCHILNWETGETIETLPDVRRVWESPYEPLALLEKKNLVFQTPDEQTIASVERETFAVLSVSFAPGLVCISESGGPIRCLNSQTGAEIWRYSLSDEHFLKLGFNDQNRTFVGVCWEYKRGGKFRLYKFEPESGKTSVVAELPTAATFAFCQRGSRLLSSNGSIIDTDTGQTEEVLTFPT